MQTLNWPILLKARASKSGQIPANSCHTLYLFVSSTRADSSVGSVHINQHLSQCTGTKCQALRCLVSTRDYWGVQENAASCSSIPPGVTLLSTSHSHQSQHSIGIASSAPASCILCALSASAPHGTKPLELLPGGIDPRSRVITFTQHRIQANLMHATSWPPLCPCTIYSLNHRQRQELTYKC